MTDPTDTPTATDPFATWPRPLAFVMSGGGAFGSVQVGMLGALAERGVRPDMVVGTSAGALHGAIVASHPDDPFEVVSSLTELWARLDRRAVFGGRRQIASNVIRSRSLSDGSRLAALIDDGEPSCEQFRGLWGVDTGDPLQGERGPSGPKFDRRGEVRASWADPLGFAGLHGTPPPSAVAARVNAEKLERVIDELDEQIRHRARKLPLAHQTDSADEMADESRRLTELLRQRTELDDLRRRVTEGRWRTDRIRDHLRQPAVPIESAPRSQPLLAAWAAISVPICLAALAAVFFLDRVRIDVVVLALASVAIPLDLVVRRRFAASLSLVAVETGLVAVALTAAWALPRAGAPVLGGLLVCGALVLLARNVSELGRTE
ncbi:MAG: patatin-like phospholipase family protein [Actinomycetota bacterium]